MIPDAYAYARYRPCFVRVIVRVRARVKARVIVRVRVRVRIRARVRVRVRVRMRVGVRVIAEIAEAHDPRCVCVRQVPSLLWGSDLQGYLAHKKQHRPLGPPCDPSYSPSVGF